MLFKLTLAFLLIAKTTIAMDSEILFAQCGGAVDADQGFITYPEINQTAIPGEICIWTIHLESLAEFRLSFSHFNVTSENNEDCNHAGVRIYSINSLFTGTEPESYTFCDGSPPFTSFFMGQSIIALVFYSLDPSSGFTLNWEGSSFDSSRTKHLSNVLRTAGAPIMYPVIGSFEENLAATWLVKADGTATVDINFHYLEMEPCAAPDPCFCDALFLYELDTKSTGKPPSLVLSSKMCTNLTEPIQLNNVNSRFILALFTDRENTHADLGRFGLIYYPTQDMSTTISTTPDVTTTIPTTIPTTTTPTTTAPTTTTPTTTTPTTTTPTTTTPTIPTTTDPDFFESTQCGDVLDGKRGRISYKVNQDTDAGERCFWIIRTRKSTQIVFRLAESGLSADTDSINISALRNLPRGNDNDPDPTDSYFHRKAVLKNAGASVTVIGSVAIVHFSTVDANGQGFVLEFEGDESSDTDVAAQQSSDNMLEGSSGSLKFPASANNYANLELSTFVFLPSNNLIGDSTLKVNIVSTGIPLEGCYDTIRIFNFQSRDDGFEQHRRICEIDFNAGVSYATNSTSFMVFLSDNTYTNAGFTINWQYETQNSN